MWWQAIWTLEPNENSDLAHAHLLIRGYRSTEAIYSEAAVDSGMGKQVHLRQLQPGEWSKSYPFKTLLLMMKLPGTTEAIPRYETREEARTTHDLFLALNGWRAQHNTGKFFLDPSGKPVSKTKAFDEYKAGPQWWQ